MDIGAQIKAKLINALKDLPAVIANEAVNFSLDNFKQQAFTGAPIQKWPARRSLGKRAKGRSLLVQSGRLRRSIHPIKIESSKVVIGTDVPYAALHNYGYMLLSID